MEAIIEMQPPDNSSVEGEERQQEQQEVQRGKILSVGQEEEDMAEDADGREIDEDDENNDGDCDDEEEEEVLVLVDLPEYAGVALFEKAESIEIKVKGRKIERGGGGKQENGKDRL